MRKHAALQHRRLQTAGYQHGSTGDKAIHHNHAPLQGCLQHSAHQRGHLIAAQRGQCGQRRGGLGIRVQRLLQHGAFALDACSIQARASARDVRQGQARQARQQQRCDRGVGNAHLAEQQRIAGQGAHHLYTVSDRLSALLRSHGWADRCVGRAGRHLAQQQLGRSRGGIARRDGLGHAAVHHGEGQAVLASQHAHGSATGQKVLHHLPSHVTGEGRHPLGRQAMVARAHQHLRLQQRWSLGAQHLADAQGQRLQPTQ
ncbi:hypothetical protein D3C71_1278480 [compost metagenome]